MARQPKAFDPCVGSDILASRRVITGHLTKFLELVLSLQQVLHPLSLIPSLQNPLTRAG